MKRTNKIQKNVTFVTVVLLVILSGCIGIDDFLKTDMISEPVAIFECNVQRADGNSLILLGIKDSSLIAGLRQWTTIGFFLKNTNIDHSVVRLSRKEPSNYIHFAQVQPRYFDGFVKDFPQLTGMEIFAVYFDKLTVKQESLLRFKTLGDGDLRNMLPRQVEYIKNRKMYLMVTNLTRENDSRYKKQVGNTFRSGFSLK